MKKFESEKAVNAEILVKLKGNAKEDFKAGLRKLGMEDPEDKNALRAAFKQAQRHRRGLQEQQRLM